MNVLEVVAKLKALDGSHVQVYKHRPYRRLDGKPLDITTVKWLKQKAIAYKGSCCADCGYENTDIPGVFEFDHLPEEQGKVGSINQCIREGWLWEELVTELDKCELVCVRCHRIRTSRRVTDSSRQWLDGSE